MHAERMAPDVTVVHLHAKDEECVVWDGPMPLEDRLTEFVQWLADKHDVHLFQPGRHVQGMDNIQIRALILDYANG